MKRIHLNRQALKQFIISERNTNSDNGESSKTTYEFVLAKWKSFENEMLKNKSLKDGPLRWKNTRPIIPPKEEIPKIIEQPETKTSVDCILFKNPSDSLSDNLTHASVLFPSMNAQENSSSSTAPPKKPEVMINPNQSKAMSTAPTSFRYDKVSAAVRAHNRRLSLVPKFIKPNKASSTSKKYMSSSAKVNDLSIDKYQFNKINERLLSKSAPALVREVKKDQSRIINSSSNQEIKPFKTPTERTVAMNTSSSDISNFKQVTRKLSNLKMSPEILNNKKTSESKDKATMATTTALDLFGDNDSTTKSEKLTTSDDLLGKQASKPVPFIPEGPNVQSSDIQHSQYTEHEFFPNQMNSVKSYYKKLDEMKQACSHLYPIAHTQQTLPTPSLDGVVEIEKRLGMKGPLCLESPLASISKMSGIANSYVFLQNQNYR